MSCPRVAFLKNFYFEGYNQRISTHGHHARRRVNRTSHFVSFSCPSACKIRKRVSWDGTAEERAYGAVRRPRWWSARHKLASPAKLAAIHRSAAQSTPGPWVVWTRVFH